MVCHSLRNLNHASYDTPFFYKKPNKNANLIQQHQTGKCCPAYHADRIYL